MLRLPERRHACERMQLGLKARRSPSTSLPPEHGRGKNALISCCPGPIFLSLPRVKKHLCRESQDVKGLGRKWLGLCTFSFSLRPCKQRSQTACHDAVAWESVCPGCRPSVQSAVSQWLSRGLSHCPQSLILCRPARLLLCISFL